MADRPPDAASPDAASPATNGDRPLWLPTALVIAVTLAYALNQAYVFDWDACFRAFTGFAARDLVLGALGGDVRNLADAKAVLLHYSDFFEARPGSVVSYPPGQTLLLGLLAALTTDPLALSLVNVACFVALAAGLHALARRLGLGRPAALAAWALVCLHPTLVLTVWSMRRGQFEAAVVTWCLVWLIDFHRRPRLRPFLLVVTAVVGGFLYRETLALLALPTAALFLARCRRLEWDWRANRTLLAVVALLVAAASLFAAAQLALASRGQLSMFTKTYAYAGDLPGGPPRTWLTMAGYYRGQFGPEPYLGLDEAGVAAAGAPDVYRLARGRWALPLIDKTAYVASSVFANPVLLLLLLLWATPAVRRRACGLRTEVLLAAGVPALYAALLCPLGGIPDYVTPILPGLALLAGLAVDAFAQPLGGRPATAPAVGPPAAPRPAPPAPARALALAAVTSGTLTATLVLAGFATGFFEEYPPQYDYDGIARTLLDLEPGRRVGVAVDLHLAKNLAYSKLRTDPADRLACYSLTGSRLPAERLFGRTTYGRYSPLLGVTRDVPGIDSFVFRSATEQRQTEARLARAGFTPPFWDPAADRTVGGRKLFVGHFRPAYIRRLRARTGSADPPADPPAQTE